MTHRTHRAAVALRLLLLCVLAVLAQHCGDRRGGDAVVTYNCAANTREIEALEREKESLRAATGIELRLLPFSGDDKLYAMVAAGQAPDIFYVNSVMRDRLAAEGKLLELRALAAGDAFLARLRPGFLQRAYSIDSGLYSIPNWSFTIGVYYNRAAFDEAGIPYPDTAWTWDRMVEIARNLVRDSDGDGVPERYGISIGSHFIEALEIMNHAPIAWNAAALAIPPESREVYAAWRRLITDRVMPDSRRVQALGMQAPQLLASGRVAMLVEAVPHVALFETLSIPWGLAPLPRFGAKSPRCFRSESGGLAISASARNPRRAWQALQWLVSSASLYQPNPVLADVDAVRGWEQRYPRLAGSGFREVMEQSERYGYGDYRYFVRFSSWTMNAIMQRLQPKLDAVWAGSMSVDELVAAVPGINAAVRDDLGMQLRSASLRPAFRARLEEQYRTMNHTAR